MEFRSESRPITPPSPIQSSAGEPRPRTPSPLWGFGGSSNKKPIRRLDDTFNFQIVVFQVEDTLFQVLKNGFNVPGTPFETMFATPQASEDILNSPLEGSTLGEPIDLSGIKVEHFRAFLRILYPFIGQVPVTSFEDWVGVLDLATMWFFDEIRTKAINALTGLMKEKPVLERIALARKYRVPDWLKDGYVEIAMKRPLNVDELVGHAFPEQEGHPEDGQDTSAYWKERAEKMEMFARSWEAVARICTIQTVASTTASQNAYGNQHCGTCNVYYGPGYPQLPLCKCRITTKVEEVFRKELEDLKQDTKYTDPALPGASGWWPIYIKATIHLELRQLSFPFPIMSMPGTRAQTQSISSRAQISVASLDATFDFETVVFQVENTLFRVPKNGFNVPGTPFHEMFTLPQAEVSGVSKEGSGVDNPIVLEGVKAAQFRAFLKFLYPFAGQTVEGYKDWIGVLRLSAMWFFKEIRQKAIASLAFLIKEKSVYERIALAREYRIRSWLQEAYVELVERGSLTPDEMRKGQFALDWETIARLMHIREVTYTERIRSIGQTRSYDPWGPFPPQNNSRNKPDTIITKIQEVFKTELADMEG
ncbi:hypothetical protein CVT26_003992 [Gymnopilus dilepis]|uniref:BTB domain-containing protein n=1 Tax=Gymnopilus dilepis TaxID=231916 RepID=A0A409YV81_9AGAR|nr:hypothetical protein CVT26_003992 [Gymnopilus dilepis]